ncbi:hypothetical protein [Mucilaginibacter aquatilis]|uniref:Uncharacterized protein n=1 Tax=Mucilaginibacter aquatilis TaxID=1517760 RepID=A0A6I4IBF0_9SPHI|nr:hypothetical protein [Mucilaginibacter aquatilis]MVN91258.1 hypothetical protein [Mucilaginibacter aquatilis]
MRDQTIERYPIPSLPYTAKVIFYHIVGYLSIYSTSNLEKRHCQFSNVG